MLPLVLFVRERRARRRMPRAAATRAGAAGTRRTLRYVRRYRELAWFLVAYWLYIDAVNTIIKMAVDYGVSLGFDREPAGGTADHAVRRVPGRAGVRLARRAHRREARHPARHRHLHPGSSVYAYFLDSVAEFFALAP
jgi:MFS transporter, UMF1 family